MEGKIWRKTRDKNAHWKERQRDRFKSDGRDRG